MTCVLTMPALHANTRGDSGVYKQIKGCDPIDVNWINSKCQQPGITDRKSCIGQCPATNLSFACRKDILNEFNESDTKTQFYTYKSNTQETVLRAVDCQMPEIEYGEREVTDLFCTCSKADMDWKQMTQTNIGFKRKAETFEVENCYVPSKRISPFLNTPKQRKDTRKKVLKISIKKLKQLEDPEIFLRKSVLINNTTKRLQSELRHEKLTSNKYSFSRSASLGVFGDHNNNCMSDTYMFDDPFLSGVHDEITDDMTDTLINNVFNDTHNATTCESDELVKTDQISREFDLPKKESCDQFYHDAMDFTSYGVSEDKLRHIDTNR